MKKSAALFTIIVVMASFSALRYNVGNKATDSTLNNADVKKVPVARHNNVKSLSHRDTFVKVVLTYNHCPFTKTYKAGVMALNAKYVSRGYSVIAINPYNPAQIDEERYAYMRRLMQPA